MSVPVLWRVSPSLSNSASRFLISGTFFFSFFLILFFYFLIVVFLLRHKRKATLRSSKRFCETDFPHEDSCYLYTGYRNRYFHRLLGSRDCSFLGQYKWKTTYKAKHPFGHVDWNPGSVKLSNELSDLLC